MKKSLLLVGLMALALTACKVGDKPAEEVKNDAPPPAAPAEEVKNDAAPVPAAAEAKDEAAAAADEADKK